MDPIRKMVRVAAAARQQDLTPADYAEAKAKLAWQSSTLAKAKEADLPTRSEIRAMSQYLACVSGDPIARMYANQMIEEFAVMATASGLTPAFASPADWLAAMNYVIQRAPTYSPDTSEQEFFPMSSLFVFYMFTGAGAALFRLPEFNRLVTAILESWCQFLDSEPTRQVLNPTGAVPPTEGWLSPPAQDQFCLEQSQNFANSTNPDMPYWGFDSFNAFFHREWNLADYRPLSGAGDDTVIVAANDGTVFRIANDVQACDTFWTKGQEYSMTDLLAGSPYTGDFIGGDVMQSFLDGSDYHRWHAPISGTVLEQRVIPGLTFSELLIEGLDLSAGTLSQGYQAMVNTRGLVVIENPDIGKVAVLPTGITEISSITINVEVGQTLKKGDELGYFSYGGSTLVLAFERGMIASFSAAEPPPNATGPGDCKTSSTCQVQNGCLMVRGEIAQANRKA